MKLWIRSQNKERLIVADCVFYEEGLTHKICTNCCEATFILGFYKTKERCLEIIDEIQELLKLGNPENAFYHIHNVNMPYDEVAELFKQVRKDKAIVTESATFDVVMPSVVTYEMPEE